MTPVRRAGVLWFCGLAACGDPIAVSSLPPCPDCTALVGGEIFDGETVRPGTVLLRGAQLEAVLFDEPPPEVGTVVQIPGATVLPGLIDLHAHAYFPPTVAGRFGPKADLSRLQIQALLKNGVTTFQDLGGPPLESFQNREASRRNLNFPRIYSAGPMLTAAGGHPCPASLDPSPACQTVTAADAETTVAALVDQGADALKLMVEPGWFAPLPTVDEPTLGAVVAAAEAAERPLYVHATRVEDLRLVLDAGARRLAHVPFRELLTDADAQRLAQTDTLVIPTMMFLDSLDRLAQGTLSELDDPSLSADVSPSVIAELKDPQHVGGLQTADSQRTIADALAVAQANLALLITHRVRIGAGTDAGNPGNFHGRSLRRELEAYVAAGMTPAEALRSATEVAAAALGRDDLGRLQPGATADLLIVNGDPLLDLSVLGAVHSVYKAGVEVDLPSLSR